MNKVGVIPYLQIQEFSVQLSTAEMVFVAWLCCYCWKHLPCQSLHLRWQMLHMKVLAWLEYLIDVYKQSIMSCFG